MARVLGLAQRRKDGRKMGSASVTMKSENVRNKGLFNEEHNVRSKGLFNEKRNVSEKQNVRRNNEKQSVRSKGNEKQNVRSKGLFNEKRNVNEKQNVRSKDLFNEKRNANSKCLFNGKRNEKAKVVYRGESRLAGQTNQKIQGTIRAETLHADRKKSCKAGAVLSNEIKIKSKCKSWASDESLMAEEEKKTRKKYMKQNPNDITNKRSMMILRKINRYLRRERIKRLKFQ